MAQLISLKLSRFDGSPWGFRLQGGKDFGTPLVVQKVNNGSPAEAAGLRAGDAIIRVNGTDVYNLRHKDAQDVIVRAGNCFEFTIQRGGNTTWRPSVSPATSVVPSPQPTAPVSGIAPVTKTSLAAKKQEVHHIGSGHNFSPKPFLNGTGEGPIKSIVNKQYNSPVGIYSEETIAETLSAQAEVLAGGVLGVNFKKNEKNYNAQNSEVFKMVQEADKEPRTPEPELPVNSGVVCPSSPALGNLRPVYAPETKTNQQSTSSTPQPNLTAGQNICAECERLIVGVFVRIKEKNLHVECFKCATCGTSLKNVGYYNINNKLYCDIHAKLVARQNAPSGMTPVTVPPPKSPAGTISSALSNLSTYSPSLNNHGTSPQSFSTTTNNIGGPKPFIGTSITTTSSQQQYQNKDNNLSSTSTSLTRPQSQSVTERKYFYESDSYEHFEEVHRSLTSDKPPKPSWPPIKSIEDITYPTASPIYIDPNPESNRSRSRESLRKRHANIEKVVRNREESRRSSSLIEQRNRFGPEMDRLSCPGPNYQRIELTGSKETRTCERSSSRASSTGSVRRSLTPTRITQPVPRPWTATVSTNTNLYQQKQDCQQVCSKPAPVGHHHEEQHSHRVEDTCRSEGNVHKHEHKHINTCKFICEPEPPKPMPPPVEEAEDDDIVDLSKIVPPDVAVCPKGIDAEHDYYTECEEKDEGNLHIKKTTVYEKTVELVSPDEETEATFKRQESQNNDVPEECVRRSSTVDREVEQFSNRRSAIETAEALSSRIGTQQLIEETCKQDAEERKIREEEERRAQELEERQRYEEQARMAEMKRRDSEQRRQREMAEQQRRLQEEEAEQASRQVCFSQQRECVEETYHSPPQEADNRPPSRERIIKIEMEEDKPPCQNVREVREEINVRKTCNQQEYEEQRRRSIREQVEVHQSLRQQMPEKRPTLQERRLSNRFRQQSQKGQSSSNSSCKKQVQFVQQSTCETCPLQQSPVKNTVPKEYQSPMLKALTTAPECSFSMQGSSDFGSKEVYHREVVYEEKCKGCQPKLPPIQDRPVSPFVSALTTAPDRPYTPLGQDQEGTCQCRSQTPQIPESCNGYCAPAQILYTETRKEKKCKKGEGPRPLPTPPPDYRFRDQSESPNRSRGQVPCGVKKITCPASLKKPDTIPSYQKYLVAEEQEPVQGHDYCRNRTPTPCGSKSPDSACLLSERRGSQQQIPDPFPDKIETRRYHMEEDTPRGHKTKDTVSTKKTSFVGEGASRHAHYQEHDDITTEECDGTRHIKRMEHKIKEYDDDSDNNSCSASITLKAPRPSLPCPTNQNNVSNRFPKTGVRVLPPMGPPEVRRVRHEITPSPPCPQTGVQVLPCTAHSDVACKSGVVVVPCDGIGTGGVCITPTPDRRGVSVSPCPAQSGGICNKPTCYCGSTSGNCSTNQNQDDDKVITTTKTTITTYTNDGGSTSNTNVCIKSTGGNSCTASPCPITGIPGVRSVQAPKPILKPCPKPCAKPVVCLGATKAKLPFPNIPLPNEEPAQNACEGCPRASSCASFTSTSETRETEFQPIHKPRTNLSNQITTLTLCKREKPVPTVQLYKPDPPPPTCTISSKQTQYKSETTINQSKFRSESQTTSQNQTQCTRQSQNQIQSQCNTQNSVDPPNLSSYPDLGAGAGNKGGSFAGSTAPNRGRGVLNQAGGQGLRVPLCAACNSQVRGPFISALGQIWCPEHFVCVNGQCRRTLQDIGFVEEKGQLYCEYCFEKFIAPSCNQCNQKIKGDCLNAIGKQYHPECFSCAHCGKRFGNSPFFLEEGLPYCERDWNDLFTTKCFACGFPVEAGDRWVEALNNNYHSQCFNCTMCKKNLEGQSFYAKGGRPFCKNHAR